MTSQPQNAEMGYLAAPFKVSPIAEIDRIVSEAIIDPVGAEFMAPPVQLAA